MCLVYGFEADVSDVLVFILAEMRVCVDESLSRMNTVGVHGSQRSGKSTVCCAFRSMGTISFRRSGTLGLDVASSSCGWFTLSLGSC